MSLRSNNINNLQLLCSRKLCSIKDVQAESILMMSLTLCGNYLLKEDDKDKAHDNKLSKEEHHKIYTFMVKLFQYLNNKILAYERIQMILKDANLNPQANIKARLVEPLGFYYNVLANTFVGKLNLVTDKEDKKLYIPDLLSLYLIIDFKEKTGYTFDKYDFIKNTDLNELLEIYNKANIKEKKEKNIKLTTSIINQTVINKMINISNSMIENLVKSNYGKSAREANKREKKKKSK